MLELTAKKLTLYLVDCKEISADDAEFDCYKYGIEVALSSLLNVILVLTIGLITNHFIESSGYTYCEKTTAGKSAYTVYAYNTTIGCHLYKSSGNADYIYNNQTGISAITHQVNLESFESYAGAITISKVLYEESYYEWTSEGTDTELRMGCYARELDEY